MSENPPNSLGSENKQRLLSLFERLLPLVDSLADKLRLLSILGWLVALWLVIWCYYLKHYALSITVLAGITAVLPTLVIVRFWWAVEELKNLPDVAGRMAGDAKLELQQSVQNIRAGKTPKLSFLGAGKRLWSVGAMATEAMELMGSYLSVTTLVNPFMLILGAVSFLGIIFLFFGSVILAFFI